ncbi:MAG: undecaprenyldiphospho-muramoylpentapeptide beta-N-acetylglucosaminyltransferase [Pseudomonadota bacterium]|nr:undecaprenyldiphospho-muramoylpentapeptide beta-N-acetylglucosaminyltransferase [Pseudomonadota bacterium]
MAGGTGGHVFPALAVARELLARGGEVVWLGSRHGLEAELVPKAHIPLYTIRVRGLRGKGTLSWALAPLRLLLALAEALWILIRVRPSAVLGMGGFASGPGGLGAWLLRRPLLVHEQNAVAGWTNRALAPLSRRLMMAFPGALPEKYRPEVVGNPIRSEIAQLPPPRQRMQGRSGPVRILILGGSQGAVALNELLPKALSRLVTHEAIEVRHQAGGRNLEAAMKAYQAFPGDPKVEPFIDDMAQAYSWADLVVCRSGALTIAELSAAGLASVLVPYPHAVDDHQTRNAQSLVNAGAAVLLPQDQLSPKRLADTLKPLVSDRAQLLRMAEAARALGKPQATRAVADALMELGGPA